MKEVFEQIYAEDLWNGGSGPGSNPANARPYLSLLRNVLQDYDIKSVIDLGCGDWRLYEEFSWGSIKYFGIDIVSGLIESNKAMHGTNNIRFECCDMSSKEWLGAQLVIIKDVFQHLPHSAIVQTLENCREIPFMLITNDAASDNEPDCPVGGYRPVDLRLSPYCLPPMTVQTYRSVPFAKTAVLFGLGQPVPLELKDIIGKKR